MISEHFHQTFWKILHARGIGFLIFCLVISVWWSYMRACMPLGRMRN